MQNGYDTNANLPSLLLFSRLLLSPLLPSPLLLSPLLLSPLHLQLLIRFRWCKEIVGEEVFFHNK